MATADDKQRSFTDWWGRTSDYLFGRNALIGLASFMLLVISGYATWSGMRDFILGVSGQVSGREIAGGVSVSNDLLISVMVIALTFLMWLALRESFGAQRRWSERMITLPLYIFLALWSIGFGYGFWWSLIAGNEATRTGLSGLQEDARDASGAVAARLDAVRGQIESVATWSDGQMAREESSGGSCGVPSGAGRGPLYNARRTVKDQVATLRDGIVTRWLGPVDADVAQLRNAVAVPDGGTVEERQRLFEAKAGEIRGKARSIAARSNELGKSTAAEMRALADAVSVEPGKPGFACFDATLAQRLRQAAEQADQPAKLVLRDATFSEGPAGVANAIKNLWANIGAYIASLAGFIASGGKAAVGQTAGGTPITGRDLIALLATLGIDLGLFALGVLNPPPEGPVRRDGLSATQSRLHLPAASVVRQLTSAMQTAIARAPGADLEWVRRHFFHHAGTSYFVIPNLYSVDHEDQGQKKTEELKALAMNQLAGVLDDLKLVQALTPKELKAFVEEERRTSMSDLTPMQKERAKKLSDDKMIDDKTVEDWNKRVPIRNHGLLSKASRVLDIAGWSANAQRDIEVFKLVDTEGLTPLLTLLNEGTLEKGEAAALAVNKDRVASSAKPLAIADERKSER